MKKEVFLAIAIGFGLGLVITLGIWVANKSLKSLPTTSEPTPTPIAEETQPQATPGSTAVSLTISSPENEALVNTNKVSLAGKTVAGAVLTVTYESSQTMISADQDGNFKLDVPLVSGYNTITVTAFNATGQSATQTLIVTYTTAQL